MLHLPVPIHQPNDDAFMFAHVLQGLHPPCALAFAIVPCGPHGADARGPGGGEPDSAEHGG